MTLLSSDNRTRGILSMCFAPFMLLDTLIVGYQHYNTSRLTGALDLVYVCGWLLSLISLRQLKATGSTTTGKAILIIQMILTSLAGAFCVIQMITPGANNFFYYLVDTAWPVSNSFMIVTGIFVIRARVLEGWKRYVPLLMGLWFPVCMSLVILIDRNTYVMVFTGIYSAIAWFLLGYVMFTNQKKVSF